MTISDKLICKMTELSITEKQIAEVTKIPYQTVRRVVSGETSNPGILTLLPICNELQITLDEITGLVDLEHHVEETSVPLISISEVEDLKLSDFSDLTKIDTRIMVAKDCVENGKTFAVKLADRDNIFIVKKRLKLVNGDMMLVFNTDYKMFFFKKYIELDHRRYISNIVNNNFVQYTSQYCHYGVVEVYNPKNKSVVSY